MRIVIYIVRKLFLELVTPLLDNGILGVFGCRDKMDRKVMKSKIESML